MSSGSPERVARRPQREVRFLDLWTAGWLALLLLTGLIWLGDWRIQWPVLLVPAAWALLALLRGRGRGEE
jgi:hypothetical protein